MIFFVYTFIIGCRFTHSLWANVEPRRTNKSVSILGSSISVGSSHKNDAVAEFTPPGDANANLFVRINWMSCAPSQANWLNTAQAHVRKFSSKGLNFNIMSLQLVPLSSDTKTRANKVKRNSVHVIHESHEVNSRVRTQLDGDKLMSQVECIYHLYYTRAVWPALALACVCRLNKCYTNRHSNDQSETRILAFLFSLRVFFPHPRVWCAWRWRAWRIRQRA